MKTLKIEANSRCLVEQDFKIRNSLIMVTPKIDEDWWLFRVPLSENQAIVAFPKFGTIGIGFQVEKADWNTNLPWSCKEDEIYDHIKHNKGDDSINWLDCIKAIRMLQRHIAKQFPEKAKALKKSRLRR